MSAPASGGKGQGNCRGKMPDETASASRLPSGDTTAAAARLPAGEEPVVSAATLVQLQIICERFGASPDVSPLMARQLVKRARQLSCERDCSEADALEYLLGLMAQASQGGGGPQSPL